MYPPPPYCCCSSCLFWLISSSRLVCISSLIFCLSSSSSASGETSKAVLWTDVWKVCWIQRELLFFMFIFHIIRFWQNLHSLQKLNNKNIFFLNESVKDNIPYLTLSAYTVYKTLQEHFPSWIFLSHRNHQNNMIFICNVQQTHMLPNVSALLIVFYLPSS